METITCPSCGKQDRFEEFLFSADEFCECDFPLFWAPGSERIARFEPVEAATARMPGESGVEPHGSKDCPTCRELNDRRATHCVHCGTDLYPQPVPVMDVPPPPPPRPVPIVKPVPWWVPFQWWFVAAGIALGVGALWFLVTQL